MTKDVNVHGHGQFREFVACVVANMPDIPPCIMQEWINSPKGLKKALEAAFTYYKVWRTIKIGWVVSTAGFNKLYCKRGINFDALAERMLNQINYSNRRSEVDLILITPLMLGLKNGGSYSEIREKARQAGLKVCPTDIGPFLIMEFPFNEQENASTEEYLYIAMEPLYDHPTRKTYIFNIKKEPIFNELYLGASEDGTDEKKWDANSKFIFCLPLPRN